MFIGVLKIELYMEGNRSLKDKRQMIKSFTGKMKSRFSNISVSEVGSLDLWKKSTVGLSVVGNDIPHINSILDQILRYVETSFYFRIISSETDIIHF